MQQLTGNLYGSLKKNNSHWVKNICLVQKCFNTQYIKHFNSFPKINYCYIK